MKAAILALSLAAVGCAGSPGAMMRDAEYLKRETLQASLLKDEKAMLSEEAIQKLLASKVRIPEKAKLAVHPLSHRGVRLDRSYGESVELGVLQARGELLDALEGPLQKTGRFVEITHVPQPLLPAEPSLTRLREAAALMQSDLLLVYTTCAELVTINWLFLPNEVKVHATVEIFLVDIRTGAVPYADVHGVVHTELQSASDDRIVETQRRGEKNALIRALGEAAGGLAGFFR
jgi:hypothetical protein